MAKQNCPECFTEFNLPESAVGKRIKCNVCQCVFQTMQELPDFPEPEIVINRRTVPPKKSNIPIAKIVSPQGGTAIKRWMLGVTICWPVAMLALWSLLWFTANSNLWTVGDVLILDHSTMSLSVYRVATAISSAWWSLLFVTPPYVIVMVVLFVAWFTTKDGGVEKLAAALPIARSRQLDETPEWLR